MKRNVVIALMVIVLCAVTSMNLTEAKAAVSGQASPLDLPKHTEVKGDEKQHKHHHHFKNFDGKMSKEEIEKLRLEKLGELARYFGIDPNGKTLNQLRQEVEAAKNEHPEKWEAFKSELYTKKLEKIRELAKSKGISIENKSTEQLHKELRELDRQ